MSRASYIRGFIKRAAWDSDENMLKLNNYASGAIDAITHFPVNTMASISGLGAGVGAWLGNGIWEGLKGNGWKGFSGEAFGKGYDFGDKAMRKWNPIGAMNQWVGDRQSEALKRLTGVDETNKYFQKRVDNKYKLTTEEEKKLEDYKNRTVNYYTSGSDQENIDRINGYYNTGVDPNGKYSFYNTYANTLGNAEAEEMARLAKKQEGYNILMSDVYGWRTAGEVFSDPLMYVPGVGLASKSGQAARLASIAAKTADKTAKAGRIASKIAGPRLGAKVGRFYGGAYNGAARAGNFAGTHASGAVPLYFSNRAYENGKMDEYFYRDAETNARAARIFGQEAFRRTHPGMHPDDQIGAMYEMYNPEIDWSNVF